MSSNPLTEEELRQWVLSLPPSSIRSLEDTLKGIRDCHFKQTENSVVKIEEYLEIKDKSDAMDDIDASPPSRTTSPTSSNISLQSRSKSGKTYENGRRNLKEEDVSMEESHRRAKRRERNRLAAAKCRKRRQDKIEILQQRVSELRSQMDEINTNLDRYNTEHDQLNQIINDHKCNIRSSQSSVATRPSELKIERAEKHPSNNVFICSLSPQLINMSPLFSPATMKLLIDTINSQQTESTLKHLQKIDDSLQNSTIDSTIFTAMSSSSNSFSQSLGILNFMTPNSELLNMNFLSAPSLKVAASSASTISSASSIIKQDTSFQTK